MLATGMEWITDLPIGLVYTILEAEFGIKKDYGGGGTYVEALLICGTLL